MRGQKERDSARGLKDFAKADQLRKELEEKFGIIIEDSNEGTHWYFKAK